MLNLIDQCALHLESFRSSLPAVAGFDVVVRETGDGQFLFPIYESGGRVTGYGFFLQEKDFRVWCECSTAELGDSRAIFGTLGLLLADGIRTIELLASARAQRAICILAEEALAE